MRRAKPLSLVLLLLAIATTFPRFVQAAPEKSAEAVRLDVTYYYLPG